MMHTGRNDARRRARPRIPVRVATSNTDDAAGFDIGNDFQRFNQIDDVFSRSLADTELRNDAANRFYNTYRRPLANWRAYTQLRNRAWLRLADSPLRRLALRLDRRFGGGKRISAERWWPV